MLYLSHRQLPRSPTSNHVRYETLELGERVPEPERITNAVRAAAERVARLTELLHPVRPSVW